MPDGSLNVAPEMEMDSTGSEAKTKDPRELSTIGFPYHPLGNAIEVARAILNKGGVPLARDQLAVTMSRQLNSGYFTNDVATARIFGLIETIAGKYQLTQLGREILDPDENQARRARVKAFLNVPLYHKVFYFRFQSSASRGAQTGE